MHLISREIASMNTHFKQIILALLLGSCAVSNGSHTKGTPANPDEHAYLRAVFPKWEVRQQTGTQTNIKCTVHGIETERTVDRFVFHAKLKS
jgi:hypothetical protein